MPKKKQVRQPATLEEIRQLMDKVERRTTLTWIYSIGFGIMAIGLGFLSVPYRKWPWIVVGIGFVIMVGVSVIDVCQKKGE